MSLLGPRINTTYPIYGQLPVTYNVALVYIPITPFSKEKHLVIKVVSYKKCILMFPSDVLEKPHHLIKTIYLGGTKMVSSLVAKSESGPTTSLS